MIRNGLKYNKMTEFKEEVTIRAITEADAAEVARIKKIQRRNNYGRITVRQIYQKRYAD